MKVILGILALLIVGVGGFWFAWHRPYSVGQRAGYVQNLSRSAWPCKTWQGEMTMVGSPLSGDRFHFNVPSDAVAATLNTNPGKLVALQYDQHKGLITPCFGHSGYFVTGARLLR
jgi:hypothetical protein